MRIICGSVDADDPAMDLAVANAMVRQVAVGQLTESLRVYRPAGSVVVFGRRDTRLSGFPDAVAAARHTGFTPLVRVTGGRAVAYTDEALVLDHVAPSEDAPVGHTGRFERFGEAYADALRELGIDARLGAVPGEYCPGAHSVNARGTVKLVGTAQRIVKGAWLFSSLVILGDHTRLRPVLGEVYSALGQPFDATSVGSLRGEVPDLDIEGVRDALVAAHGTGECSELGSGTLALAKGLVADHRVDAVP